VLVSQVYVLDGLRNNLGGQHNLSHDDNHAHPFPPTYTLPTPARVGHQRTESTGTSCK
jgi:hypothetical protein